MGNGRTTLRAEDAVDGLAGGAVLCVALGWALDGQGILGDDSDKGCRTLESALQRLGDYWWVCIAYSRLNRSGAGSHRSGRRP